MFLYEEYISGKGLNLSDYKVSGCDSLKKYQISVVHKYNFVILDYENTNDLYSEILNFKLMVLKGGYVIVRKKLSHPEEYKIVSRQVKDFSYNGFSLKKFFIEDNVASFIFKKEEEFKALSVHCASTNKEKIVKALHRVSKIPSIEKYLKGTKIFCKDEIWKDEDFYPSLPKFNTVSVFCKYETWGNNTLQCWHHLINSYNGKNLLLIDENFDSENFDINKPFGKDYIFITDMMSVRKVNGLDYRYNTTEWAIYDLARKLNYKTDTPKFQEHDYYRYNLKEHRDLYNPKKRDITVMEALGDNILAFNIINNLVEEGKEVNIRTVCPFLYELSPEIKSVNNKKNQFMDGIAFTVYEHGHEMDSPTLEQAYFTMWGHPEFIGKRPKRFPTLKYVNNMFEEYGRNIIAIAPSASNAEGPDNGIEISNKTWPLERWEEIVEHLQKKGFTVIQVGTEKDLQLEKVDYKFFNKSFEELVCFIKACKFFLSIDTFFQHLCGLMDKKGIVITPRHNEHAYWPSIEYIRGDNFKEDSEQQENYEHLKWIKDHLNPYRKPCMESITIERVKERVDNLVSLFDKY